VLLGLFGFTGAGGLTMLTLTYLPAGITSLLSNTTPLMLVLGVAVATRTFSALPTAGAVVGFVGVAVLSLGNVAPSAVQSTNAALIGVPMGLLSSAFWAGYTIYARRLAGSDPLVTTTLTSGLGTLFIGLVAVPTQDWSNIPTLAPLTMACIAFVGCVSMALTYVGWSFALSRLPATTVAPFSYLIPVLGLLVAHLVLGEDLTIAVVLGAALVLGGIALSQTTTWRALLRGRVKR
jgi:O-acetylserine/cysteine efflux transporter